MFKAKRSLGKIALLLLAGIFVTSQCYGMQNGEEKKETTNKDETIEIKNENEPEKNLNSDQLAWDIENWNKETADSLRWNFKYRELMKYLYHHLDGEFPNNDTVEWFNEEAIRTHFIGLYFRTRNFHEELDKKGQFSPFDFKREVTSVLTSLALIALNTGICLRVNNSNSETISRILDEKTNAYNIIRLKFQKWFKPHFEKFIKKAPYELCLKESKKMLFTWATKLTDSSLIPFIWVPYIKFKTSMTWGITFEKEIPKEEIECLSNPNVKALAVKNALELLILIFEKYEKCKDWSDFFELHVFDKTIKTIYNEISSKPIEKKESLGLITKQLGTLNGHEKKK